MESEKQPSLEDRYQQLKEENSQLARRLERSDWDQRNLQRLLEEVTKERDVALSRLEQEQKVVLHLERKAALAEATEVKLPREDLSDVLAVLDQFYTPPAGSTDERFLDRLRTLAARPA